MGRGRFSKVVSVLVTGVIAMSGLPSAVLADVINAPTYYSVQSGLNYEITTNVTSSWINHTSVDFVVSNTGDETIHNWYLTFNTPYAIDNIWNGALYETDGNGTYTITSNGWNQDINPGETVTVGATFSSTEEESLTITPEWYLLNTEATVVDDSLYTLDYLEYSSWESGFTGQLTLQPQVDCQHWSLTFTSNRDITAVSSAVLNTEDDGSYEITHDENNMRLFANNAYNFGIQGVNTEDPLEFTDVELTVVDLAYHLTDDVDGNGTPDYLDYIGGGIVVGPTPTPSDVPTESPTEEPTETPTITPTAEPSISEEPTETVTPTEEPTPTVFEVDPYYDLDDSDNDGLLDYLELMYLTDINNPDTDGDGLLDGDEININTNPKNPDSDGNGTSDFEEDYDGDGIHNGGEYATGTCMFAYDSDYDGVNDYNEVYFYGIDPNNEDSDFDGIKDGDEVTLGLNPGSNDSNGDGITDDYVMFEQSLVIEPIADDHPHEITSVQISGGISGLITSNTTIEDMYNRDAYCTDVCGRVGIPISLESEGHFDSMTLTISYDDSILGETDENNLGVLWYNEENGFFIVQEQAIVDTTNNTVTLALNHFSTYILVDLNKWNNLQITPTTSITGSVRTITWSTRGVYYDAFPIYEQNEAGEWVDTGRFYGGTINPERYENTAWNNYLEYHPNDVRVETVNIRYIRDAWGGLSYVYTWKVYTTDTTNIDNDHDGLPDNLEISGILGTNGEVYYSNPDSADSDGDTLADGEEIGNLYLLHRGEDGELTISLNNTVIYEAEEGFYNYDSEFAFLERYVDDIDYGQYLGVASIASDPKQDDTDEDGYKDNIDARPIIRNSEMNYIITSPDFYDCSRRRANKYRENGISVMVFEISDTVSFEKAWNVIGLFVDSYNDGVSRYGDKYYYDVHYVVICTHGSPSYLQLNKTGNPIKYRLYSDSFSGDADINNQNIITPSLLTDKIIYSLNIYACSVGADCGEDYNVAESFLHGVDGVSRVIAPDTTLSGSADRYFFKSYREFDDVQFCTEEQYNQIIDSLLDYFNTITYYHYDNYSSLKNAHGFLIFTEEGIVDYYSDDVFYGTLYTIDENYESGVDGMLTYDYSIINQLGSNWHDPVLG